MYKVCLLYVSATILALLSVVNYREYVTKLFEPVHKYKGIFFLIYGLKFTLKCKIQMTFL